MGEGVKSCEASFAHEDLLFPVLQETLAGAVFAPLLLSGAKRRVGCNTDKPGDLVLCQTQLEDLPRELWSFLDWNERVILQPSFLERRK